MEKGDRFNGRPDFLAKFMEIAAKDPKLPPG